MTYEKFIDDGIGLIIHPPKKDVEKQEDDLEKYNRCHGPNGRFCSGGSGGGGGGGGGAGTAPSESGPRDETPEERSAREAWEAGARASQQVEPEPAYAFDENRRIEVCVDKVGLPVEDREAIWSIGEHASYTMGSPKNLQSLHIEKFDEKNDALAMCSYSFAPGHSEARMRIDPYKFDRSREIYREDQIKISSKQLPWGASSYAKTEDEGIWGVFQHEAAHAKFIEHTASKDPVLWANRDDPAQGDTKWMSLTHKAFSKGWQGPSEYGLKDLGECFAESATKLVITGSTGNKSVDKYVKGVLQWES